MKSYLMKAGLCAITLFMNLAAMAPLALGHDCAKAVVTTADEAKERLDLLREELCLGDRNCRSPLCEKISALETAWKGKPPKRELYVKSAELLREIQRSSADLPHQGAGVPQLEGMLEKWNATLSAVGEIPDSQRIAEAYTREWKPSVLRLFTGTSFQIDLGTTFDNLCTSEPQCQSAFDSATEVYSHSVMVYRILYTLISHDLAKLGKYLETLDKRWEAFHNDSRGTYPWELWLNGKFYSPRQEGFSEPPSSQILLLHPSVGLAYRDSEQDNLSEIMVLDVVGSYWWNWGGQYNAEIVRPMGLALATTWDGNEVSYGLSAHFPKNWSVGVVSADDGDISVLLSLDLANYITNKRKSVEELREKFRKYR